MTRCPIAVLLIALVPACAGGRKNGAKQAEAPPSVEQLKEMISRAASIRPKTFQTIAAMGPFGRSRALHCSPHQPLTLMILATIFEQAERDLKVELPTAPPARTLSPATRMIVINIRAGGQILVAGKLYRDEKALRDLLTRAAAAEASQKVLIRCDKEVRHKYLVGVIQACRQAGIGEANIGFATARRVRAGDATPPEPTPKPIDTPATAPSPREKPGDFRLLPLGGVGRAERFAEAICGGRKLKELKEMASQPDGKAYVSVIRPEYITRCTRRVQGDTIAGKVSFRAEGVYEGAVEYTAGRGPDGWRIEEFRLPLSGRRTVLTVRGTWLATPDPAWFEPARDETPKPPPPPPGPPRESLRIDIGRDGTLAVDSKVVDLAALRRMLSRLARDHPQRRVLIRSDGGTLHKHLVEVMSLCAVAGIRDLKIDYSLGARSATTRPARAGP